MQESDCRALAIGCVEACDSDLRRCIEPLRLGVETKPIHRIRHTPLHSIVFTMHKHQKAN